MKYLQKLNNFLAKIESIFLIVCLLTRIMFAFVQVLLRNIFSTAIFGGDTFLRHLVLWVGFLGATLATKQSKHINIDVLSRTLSPRLKKNIGYAFIPIEYAKNDTEFEIRSPYANLKAKVVPLPFFDPKKKIPIK